MNCGNSFYFLNTSQTDHIMSVQNSGSSSSSPPKKIPHKFNHITIIIIGEKIELTVFHARCKMRISIYIWKNEHTHVSHYKLHQMRGKWKCNEPRQFDYDYIHRKRLSKRSEESKRVQKSKHILFKKGKLLNVIAFLYACSRLYWSLFINLCLLVSAILPPTHNHHQP